MVQQYEDNIIQPPIQFRDDCKSILKPRRSVKKMVRQYEENIILPPIEFRNETIPKPRTKITKLIQALKSPKIH